MCAVKGEKHCCKVTCKQELGCSPIDEESQQRNPTPLVGEVSIPPCFRPWWLELKVWELLGQSNTSRIWEELLLEDSVNDIQSPANTLWEPDVCVVGDKQNQLAKQNIFHLEGACLESEAGDVHHPPGGPHGWLQGHVGRI